MKTFVTGGTGFIGSHVVMMLLAEGHDVTVLARNPNKIPMFRDLPRLTLVQGDARDYARHAEWLAGHDTVVHLALCWGNSPTEMLQNDTQTTVTLLEKSGEAGVKHFLYTSSTAAFGGFKPIMTEEMKSDPVDWYCATKAASECYAIAASYKYPMRVNIIRPGYTFSVPVAPGAPMGPEGFIEIAKAAKKNEDITTKVGDGTQFICATDLAKLYRAVLNSDVNRQIYHGLSQPWVSWADIAKLAIEKTGSSSRVVVAENPGRETPDLFDLKKIETQFGFHFEPWPHIVELVEYLAKME